MFGGSAAVHPGHAPGISAGEPRMLGTLQRTATKLTAVIRTARELIHVMPPLQRPPRRFERGAGPSPAFDRVKMP
ncbi:hypothetical protein ARTHROSP310_37670 [Arthrobacter sp. AD-310]